MAYKIEVHRTAQRQLLSLPGEARTQVSRAIDQLARNPRPSGCRKLKSAPLWRLRTGRYRVIYSIADTTATITILKVATRKEDTYKDLDDLADIPLLSSGYGVFPPPSLVDWLARVAL